MEDLSLAFYGDDMTGSTDAMDALARSGIETVLFLDPPDPTEIELEFPDIEAVGIAGTSRSMDPNEMRETLSPAFESLVALEPPLVQYKICSTFDSAPDIGNIGCAIEIAAEIFENTTVPIHPAAPPLGRYVVFGNMFAQDLTDVYRLDRHPTMRDHPTTPMDESDLRRHLANQTDVPMDLIDVLTIDEGLHETKDRLTEIIRDETSVIFFDGLTDAHLRTTGGAIWETYGTGRTAPSFVVGSSGFQYALADHWQSTDRIDRKPDFDPVEPVDQLLVMSGSASPLTATQIEAAVDAGFASVRINTADLVDPEMTEAAHEQVFDAVTDALDDGESVVLYTAHGPDDSAIEETKHRAQEVRNAPDDLGRFIGTEQGRLLHRLLDRTSINRVCIAGGDTCGYATPMLDVYALRTRFPLAPGSPLCTARSRTERFDGIEIALKGGQLGGPDYFVRTRDGTDEWKQS
jgi:3-oxoisoapionate kinase